MSIVKPARRGQPRSERLRDIIDAVDQLAQEALEMEDAPFNRERARQYWHAHLSMATSEPVMGEETLMTLLMRVEEAETPYCDECREEISQADVNQYREDVSGDPDGCDEVPRICSVCADRRASSFEAAKEWAP
jgi:hypothetical protein